MMTADTDMDRHPLFSVWLKGAVRYGTYLSTLRYGKDDPPI